MFTGIVEDLAIVKAIQHEDGNVHYTLSCQFVDQLQIDQSIAHNGACLTVVALTDTTYTVTAIEETLKKTNLQYWAVGDAINVERSLKLSDRLDGHMVQGHVDQVGELKNIEDQSGSYLLTFTYTAQQFVTVPKGSICVNGISLTVVDSQAGLFSVAIIPYTWEHTNLKDLKMGDKVNLEFDILGKYVWKMLQRQTNKS